MNNQYISFWQNTLTDAFNPDKQTETFNTLFSQSFSQFEDISTALIKLTEGKSVTTPDDFFTLFNISTTDYHKSINLYMELFGLISIDEYRSLIKKYEKLKKEKQSNEKNDQNQKSKVETQNKTIQTQKDKIASQEKQLSTQKASLTKAKKEMAELKKELAKKQESDTPIVKKPAKITKNNKK